MHRINLIGLEYFLGFIIFAREQTKLNPLRNSNF